MKKIHFAPLDVPVSRRIQTLVLTWHVFSIPLFSSAFMLCCAFIPLWPLVFAYVIFMIFDNSPENGGASDRYSLWFRSLPIWYHYANFFPITLHKTVDLEPSFVIDSENESKNESKDELNNKGEINGTASQSKKQRAPPRLSRFFSLLQLVYRSWKIFFWWYYAYLKATPSPKYKPTGKKYIFGYHPHGIIGMGAIGGFSTEGAGWSKEFPGIKVSVLTLKNNFLIPFYRDYVLALGIASVSRQSCVSLLKKGQSICILVGGAQESLLARPGTLDLVLNKRKGFIKLALQVGNTDLVPVIGFGENDLYDQVKSEKNSRLYKLQTFLKDMLGFTLPLMHARGVFNYDVGIIPYRRPINIVFGRPISIPHIPQPTEQQLNKFQSLYIDELERLFHDNKAKYMRDWKNDKPILSENDLRIVE